MTSTLRDQHLVANLLREHDVPSIPLESSAIAAPEYLSKVSHVYTQLLFSLARRAFIIPHCSITVIYAGSAGVRLRHEVGALLRAALA